MSDERESQPRLTDAATTVQQLRELVANFVQEREWERFHDPKNLSMAIAIEAAELMEHFQWLRSEELPGVLADDRVLGEIRDELADIACFVLALSNRLGLDLASAVQQKMVKNIRKYPADRFRGIYYKERRTGEGHEP